MLNRVPSHVGQAARSVTLTRSFARSLTVEYQEGLYRTKWDKSEARFVRKRKPKPKSASCPGSSAESQTNEALPRDNEDVKTESTLRRGAEAVFAAIGEGRWPLIEDPSMSKNQPYRDITSVTEYFEEGTGRRLVSYMFMAKPPELSSLESVMDYHRPPQSLWAHAELSKQLAVPWYRKKTYVVELCVTRLVLELCIASGLIDLSGQELERMPMSIQSFAALSSQYAAYVARQIELELITVQSFPSDDYPAERKIELVVSLPSYSDRIDAATEELNKGLIRACSQKEPYDGEFIGRICSHLLRSRGRPDINTINQLLLTFISRRRHDLVWPLQALVYDGHFRPNELTCAAILRFYRQIDDHNRFMDYVVMMYGEKSGLMLAMPWKKSKDNLDRSHGRILRKGEKLVQAVTPSSLVYLETIMGMIHFRGLRQSWRIFENLASRGWGFDYTCMYVLLFQAAVAKAGDIFAQVWSEARYLASYGYLIPKRLYALAIAAHYINYEPRRSLELLKEYLARESSNEEAILGLIKQRVEMIKQMQAGNDNEQKDVWERFDVDYDQTQLPEELRVLDS